MTAESGASMSPDGPESPSVAAPPAVAAYPPEVQELTLGGRQLFLVGTAHISRSSVDLVRQVIEQERPDCVCVELDPQRYQSLTERRKWEALDLKEIIRKKQLTTLLVNLLLASFQKRLGSQLGVEPGAELLEATTVARALDIPIRLCDRDVRITLRRAARATSFFRKLQLASYLLASIFDTTEVSEEQLQELKQQDVLNEMLQELGRAVPSIKTVLLDERDAYLAAKIRAAEGEKIVAVVGAGHMQGIKEALEEERTVDLEALEEIPPVSKVWKAVGWGVPALILGALGWIAWSKGLSVAGDNLAFWVLINGACCAIGALLAFAHPLTIATAFLAAPLTSLTPVIGAGYVTAFVQAYLRPPVVREFQNVTEDIGIVRRWWSNKLLRILLAFVLPNIGSMVGTWVGGAEIIRNLF